MKARIKETGEVLKVADYALIAMENCDSHGNPLEYKPEEVELIPDTPATDEIDWESRRFELVKAAMQGIMCNEVFSGNTEESIARMAISQADAILAEYRKGGKE